MSKRRKNISRHFLAISLMLAAVAWTGCKGSATAPKELPIAKASVEVLNLHTTIPFLEYDASCQTNGLVVFRPVRDDVASSSPSGEPVILEWTFLVDRGAGLEAAPDWGGNGTHVKVDADTGKPMSERVLAVHLLTIGFHEVTLRVRTRDGRSSSTTLKIAVTSCENCG
jgi:hypothetical protein